MKDAMKSGDEIRKRTVRMALAAVKQAEVDRRVELDDVAVIALIQKEVKKTMPAEELRAIIQAAIAETGAASPADMGKVMKTVMPKVAGRAPNDMVSASVKELLQPR
jgi:uncharacterized protein YqeY